MDTNKVDTIIFDAGGVLFYIKKRRNEIAKEVLLSMGYDESSVEVAIKKGQKASENHVQDLKDIVTWEDERAWLMARYKVVVESLDGPEVLADKLFHLTFDTFQYQLFEETISVLERLQKKYTLAVLSNATASLDWAFDLLELRKYFKCVMISAYEKCAKPEEEIYIRLLEKLDKTPEECVFIDDKMKNVQAAKNVGIKGYHLDRNKGQSLFDFERELSKL